MKRASPVRLFHFCNHTGASSRLRSDINFDTIRFNTRAQWYLPAIPEIRATGRHSHTVTSFYYDRPNAVARVSILSPSISWQCEKCNCIDCRLMNIKLQAISPRVLCSLKYIAFTLGNRENCIFENVKFMQRNGIDVKKNIFFFLDEIIIVKYAPK